MVTGILLMRPKRPGTPPQTPPSSSPIIPSTRVTKGCGDVAVPCSMKNPDCGCGFVCTQVGPGDTDFGAQGTYCLPPKPAESKCGQEAVDTSMHMQGKLHWSGWHGVNVQQWKCACPYPLYYPMDPGTGRCTRSAELCRGGTWTYPLRRKVVDGTVTYEEGVAGSDPLQNGVCSCDNVACNTDEDCAGKCMNGTCVDQRLSMNPDTGLPECVKDTCRVALPCKEDTPCPGGATCKGGFCDESTSSCPDDATCGPGGECVNGRCKWGKWSLFSEPPYLFGECECPDGCTATGTVCRC